MLLDPPAVRAPVGQDQDHHDPLDPPSEATSDLGSEALLDVEASEQILGIEKMPVFASVTSSVRVAGSYPS